jgi:hypothetical protein
MNIYPMRDRGTSANAAQGLRKVQQDEIVAVESEFHVA